ncbi:helix-turn-helix transcriptional regulator [Bacillus sp. JJ634]
MLNKRLIKYCRFLSGYTQKELASKAGVHDSLISKAEAGVLKLQPHTEQKLIEVFSDAGIDIQLVKQVDEMIMNDKKGV